MANLATVAGISYMSTHLRFRNLRRTNGSLILEPDKDEKERRRMKYLYIKIILVNVIFGSIFISSASIVAAPVMEPPSTVVVQKKHLQIYNLNKNEDKIIFKHGDVSWLPKLASQVGWPKNTHKRLAQIILRESGGCPNRFGGSIVDKNCNIIGHDGSNHRSDSGLLQINGVNWDPKRNGRQLLCADHKICTQQQLLDPLINLRAGYILYQKAGWDPWDPCAWGPAFAHRCKP